MKNNTPKKIMDAATFVQFCKNFAFTFHGKQTVKLASTKVLNEIFKGVNKNVNK